MMRVRNHNCSTLFALAAAALAVLLTAQTAHAAAYTYGTHQRTINAGILLLDDTDSTGKTISGMGEGDPSPTPTQILMGADNPDPYVFYVLNQRNDIKPFGWNIVNPLAPTTITNTIQTRWNARSANAYTLYQRVTSNMAPYWEVPLAGQTNLDVLLQFDVLLLNLQNRTVRLTTAEAEMLRRFVDGGGQLWVENSGGGDIYADRTSSPYGPLFFDMRFNNGASAGQALLPVATGTSVLQHHPIIDAPYQLTQGELNSLGENPNHIQATITSGASISAAPDTTLLSTVVGNSGANDLPVIAAGQMGAGQVVVTTTASNAAINDAVGGTNPGFGVNSGPYCGQNYNAAPAADLKFVVDLLSWDTAHPNELKNSHQSSQSRSSLGPAVTPIWSFAGSAGTSLAPGAAINGDYVYARGADGVLHTFNAAPGTDILGTGTPDAGIPDFINGQSYDEIWNSHGGAAGTFPGLTAGTGLTLSDALLSAPTVAAIPSGQTLVFVEDRNGLVHAADAITGAKYATTGQLPVQTPGSASYGSLTPPIVAPAPTYYGGRIYAGQPDGYLYVYDFDSSGSANPGIRYQFTGTEPVIASPTVGIVRDTVSNVPVDDITAALSTDMGVYTVMLGARHDAMTNNAGTLAPTGVSVPSQFTPAPLDSGAPFLIYSETAAGYPVPAISPYSATTTYFGDYDVVWAASPNGYLNRAEFTANPAAATGYTYTSTPSTISASALGSNGNLYYTVDLPTTIGHDSTLVCAHDVRQSMNPPTNRINWRFRLPYTNEAIVDADNISYTQLEGFRFQGAPVVDGQGNVFALAVNNTGPTPQAAILCFRGNQAVTFQAVASGTVPAGYTPSFNSVTQPIPSGTDEFGGGPPQAINGLQYTPPDLAYLSKLINFGTSGVGALSSTISPNVSEPQPLFVQGQFNPPPPPPTLPPIPFSNVAPLHTNLLWYAILPDLNPLSGTAGITLVGNYLFYGDGNGYVYRLYAYPQNSSLISADRSVTVGPLNAGTLAGATKDNDGRAIFAAVLTTAGAITGPPSASGDVLVVNGLNGVVALGSRFTLVADGSRILETDSEGVASWAVDATTQTTAPGTLTHLELNRPASVFQFAANDYLVADTGNSRCVRFDRQGNVLWELTRFNDVPDSTFGKATTLLTPGEPTTLSHPTSVQTYQTYVADTVNGGTGTIVHYLIADTGNYRVLEVADVYNGKGQLVAPLHNLVWVSHTYDVQHRSYRYTSASYFTGPPNTNGSVSHYVAALISNVRLKTPLPATPGQLNPSTTDAPGSSLVLLDYDPISTVGLVAAAASSYHVYLQPPGPTVGQFDINGAPKLQPPAIPNNPPTRSAATGMLSQVYLRNPRFLQTYTPPGGQGALQNFLLADDNGVFDLFLNTSVIPHRFEAQWGYTQADYRASAAFGLTRSTLSFLPSSLQRTSTETVPDTTSATGAYLMGQYIAVNGYSTGEVTPTTGFGGEALELNDIAASASSIATQIYSSISKPGNTAPLSQPTFAVRAK